MKRGKLISVLTVLAMLLALLPGLGLPAFAVSTYDTIDVNDVLNEYLPGGVTYGAPGVFTIDTGTVERTITVTGTTNVNSIVVADGVTNLTLILDNVSISNPVRSPIALQGNASVTIVLAENSDSTLTATGTAISNPGLSVPADAEVFITGGDSGTGALTATGSSFAAGIGGDGDCGEIDIENCTVTATGGEFAAGIGGGQLGDGGMVTVWSGTVTATGGNYGAGIGGGFQGKGRMVTVWSGAVTATGGFGAAGIGGGLEGDGAAVVVYDGAVTAFGGSNGGAGIGGGHLGDGFAITVYDGTVNATGGGYAAGIGGGYYGDGGSTYLWGSGAEITATGGGYAAGIGGGYYGDGGTIDIIDVTVTATGGISAAGIGGGAGGSGGTISISGPGSCAVNATGGGSSGAGIGGGFGGDGGSIEISGGTVNATASDQGAGIGGGLYGVVDDITISGGTVTVMDAYWGAGIGSGYGAGTICTITVSGGTVTADSFFGAGIGSGGDAPFLGAVTVSGGTVTADSVYGAGIGSGMNGSVGGTIAVSGGTVTASSGVQAMSVAPDLTGYTAPHTEIASENRDGSDYVTYVPADLAAYRYIRIGLSETPAAPSGLAWDGTAAVWTPVTGAVSYTVQLSKDGSPAGSPVTGVTGASWDFSSAITSAGSYTFTVTAIGDGLYYTDSPESGPSPAFAASAPAITSANSQTFTAGVFGIFTVTATGNPTPSAISKSGALPAGVTFTDNGDGTATLSGTPAMSAGGVYRLTITAGNGVLPNATQSFTLTVTGGSSGGRDDDEGSEINGLHTSTAAGLPYFLGDGGAKVFIGFAVREGEVLTYIEATGKTVYFADNAKSFSDTGSHWAKNYIDFVTSRELFLGMGGGLFNPEGGMTRAMFATVIGRLYERSYGMLPAASSGAFSDVDYGGWYGRYVKWASDIGIITGVGGGKFNPNANITRQEMAAMLYRFAQYIDVAGDLGTTGQLAYPDAASIAVWARAGALYCQNTGIITGRSGGNFVPQGTATRAEVAAILERFIESVLS